MNNDPVEAARRSLDPERRLPGENLDSTDPEDAAHWVGVYRELKETKQSLAKQLEAGLKGASGAARAELESVDAVLIRVQLDRFQRRLEYWSERERDLRAATISER
jgi:hypothetical protein